MESVNGDISACGDVSTPSLEHTNASLFAIYQLVWEMFKNVWEIFQIALENGSKCLSCTEKCNVIASHRIKSIKYFKVIKTII